MSNNAEHHTATRLLQRQGPGGRGILIKWTILTSAELYAPNVVKGKLPRLLAFYPFDFGPWDVSGNARHAKVTGSPQPVPGYLDQGQAYLFNGATDYLTAPLDINPNQYPKLTMGCWAKTTSALVLQQLLTHDNGDFDRSIGIDFRGNGIGWSAFGGPEGQVLGAVPAILDQWTFVAVVYDQTAGDRQVPGGRHGVHQDRGHPGFGPGPVVHRRQSRVQRVFRRGH